MYIKVFVTPSAKRERVEEKGEILRIAVKEPAAGNAANRRVRELLARRFGKPLGAVQIVTGHRGRSKRVKIAD